VLLRIFLDSREAVDAMVRQAVASGGHTGTAPEGRDFLYGHGFQGPEGVSGKCRIREVAHLDAPPAQA
jgi:predicted lactoylglutathione lyase